MLRNGSAGAAVVGDGVAQTKRDDLERMQREGDDAVADLFTDLGLLQQVAAPRVGDPVGRRHRDADPVAERLVQPHDQVARTVVGTLHGVDFDSRGVDPIGT